MQTFFIKLGDFDVSHEGLGATFQPVKADSAEQAEKEFRNNAGETAKLLKLVVYSQEKVQKVFDGLWSIISTGEVTYFSDKGLRDYYQKEWITGELPFSALVRGKETLSNPKEFLAHLKISQAEHTAAYWAEQRAMESRINETKTAIEKRAKERAEYRQKQMARGTEKADE